VPLSRDENERSGDFGENLVGKDIELINLHKNYRAFTGRPITGFRKVYRPGIEAAEPVFFNFRRKKSVGEDIRSKWGNDLPSQEAEN
jgi:hypothetical protein